MSGVALIAAAALFWLAWLLMPGVGVTDPRQILELVGAARLSVAASVVTQLVSAVLYVIALVGVISHSRLGRSRGVRSGATLLIVGAMGSAADAVLHLLAYAMTAPGVDRAAAIPVMAFMQGPGLVMLAPLLLSFFVGGAVLAFARTGLLSRWNGPLHLSSVVLAIVGGSLASAGWMSPRLVGLVVLATISVAQAWTGMSFALHDRQGI